MIRFFPLKIVAFILVFTCLPYFAPYAEAMQATDSATTVDEQKKVEDPCEAEMKALKKASDALNAVVDARQAISAQIAKLIKESRSLKNDKEGQKRMDEIFEEIDKLQEKLNDSQKDFDNAHNAFIAAVKALDDCRNKNKPKKGGIALENDAGTQVTTNILAD